MHRRDRIMAMGMRGQSNAHVFGLDNRLDGCVIFHNQLEGDAWVNQINAYIVLPAQRVMFAG
jgi:hypothetical protein